MEEWRDIPGYESFYQVSNLGNVRSIRFNKIRNMKSWDSNGYRAVELYLNNNVENLEWVTQSENVAHAYRHGVEPRPTHQDQPFQKEILDIIENKKYFSIREASRQTGHKRDTIKRSLDLNTPVCNNTHHFIYVN